MTHALLTNSARAEYASIAALIADPPADPSDFIEALSNLDPYDTVVSQLLASALHYSDLEDSLYEFVENGCRDAGVGQEDEPECFQIDVDYWIGHAAWEAWDDTRSALIPRLQAEWLQRMLHRLRLAFPISHTEVS